MQAFLKTRYLLFAIALVLSLSPTHESLAQPNLLWARQFGTAQSDGGEIAGLDNLGNIYIAGGTQGSLGGPNAGQSDAFLAKYDPSGIVVWTRQFGTTKNDWVAPGPALDSTGNIFIAGTTEGSMGSSNAGGFDPFLTKCDDAGNLLWTRQIGTPSDDDAFGLAVDAAGNAFICGTTGLTMPGANANAGYYDAYLAKYDGAGNRLWTRQLGTSTEEQGHSIAVDSAGNAYITGSTNGSLGGANTGSTDVFLAKYDPSGNLAWTRQLGTTASEYGNCVALDSVGNIYISGNTSGSLGGANAGGADTFLAKYDSSGELEWTRQLGTASAEFSGGITFDSLGNVYIGGQTYGALGGSNAGKYDAYFAKYDTLGTLAWIHQFGTDTNDYGSPMVDTAGNIYFSGATEGSIGGPNAGSYDVFFAKFSQVPEPHSSSLLSLLTIGGLAVIRRRLASSTSTSR